MRTRNASCRSGITLTEILISIMIMGVGMVSLATLFPLGLVRTRQANQATRSALLAETATSDLGARNLLDPFTFTQSWYTILLPFTPFNFDAPPGFLSTGASVQVGVVRADGPGVPVAYDPLWWSQVHQSTNGQPAQGFGATGLQPITADSFAPPNGTLLVRFGQGIGFVRPDPNPGAGTTQPSAHGLQRLTNFIPFTVGTLWQFYYPPTTLNPLGVFDVAGDIFTSRDDIVMQSSEGSKVDLFSGLGSPVVPAFPTYNPRTFLPTTPYSNDWNYSWMFTGRVSDVGEPTTFDGNIVVFQNRPLGYESVNSPFNGPVIVPQGERVVEAIFGGQGGGNKTVILRWPSSQPDPDVRVGSWIADVTYERFGGGVGSNEFIRFQSVGQPGQRCYWYQVAKRSSVSPSTISTDPVLHNQMTVVVASPLQARTAMDITLSPPEPIHVNVALICPYVVNVFPRTLYVR